MFIIFRKPKADGYNPDFQDFNLLQFNLSKMKTETECIIKYC